MCEKGLKMDLQQRAWVKKLVHGVEKPRLSGK